MNSEWRKSSYSGGSSNQCVECGTAVGAVLIRDTADRDGLTLTVSPAAWSQFTSTIK